MGISFTHLEIALYAIPPLVLLLIYRLLRRNYWSNSLVDIMNEEIGPPNPVLRLPRLLEIAALGFLLVALLGPVFPFQLNRIERGGLQIMFVLDLSQSMEEPIGRGANVAAVTTVNTSPPPQFSNQSTVAPPPTVGSKMEAVKASALAFVNKRTGDAIGLSVFSNNGYVVSPATFDHESLIQYLHMTGTHTLVNEGFTAIGEGLNSANRYFAFSRQKNRKQSKGQVIILFTDGDNNYGRDPMTEVERAKTEGTKIYMMGVALQPGASQQIANAVYSTGGQYYDVRNPGHLEGAFNQINDIEKGIFYTLQLTENQPAYFIFVLLALGCLALRLLLHAIPQFVDLS
ncbi:MAG: VWA domain-containing protein [Acidobacteria bacterium]|nr:VWA domain-containing protein [Acidobacteriota bacterium]